MFRVTRPERGTIRLSRILEGSQGEEARRGVETITGFCDVDFVDLQLSSSAKRGLLPRHAEMTGPAGGETAFGKGAEASEEGP
jgi:hypothetical protein